jgi:hypothetical protein
VALVFAGCGYQHPYNKKENFFEGENNSIHISIIENRSYHPGIESILTSRLIEEYAVRSGGKVFTKATAQLNLIVKVISYETVPASYTVDDKIREYRSKLAIEIVLANMATGEIRWKEEISVDQIFPVNTDILVQQNAEEAAIKELCRRISREVWQIMSEELTTKAMGRIPFLTFDMLHNFNCFFHS